MQDELITLLIEAKVLNTKLKASPKAEQYLSNDGWLLQKLIGRTSYLNAEASVYERLMNIRLNITALPRCEKCDASLSGRIYLQERRYHRFCSAECRHQFVTKERVADLTAEVNGTSKIKEMAKRHSEKERITLVGGRSLLDIRLQKALQTRIANGQCSDPSQHSALTKYRAAVAKVTYRQPIHLLPNVEKRGHIEFGGWHLDHKYSVNEGFLNNVPPEIIGDICNLEMICSHQNVKKQHHCSITLAELLSEYNHRTLEQAFPTTLSDRQHAVS